MSRIAFLVEYNGARYSGFQTQTPRDFPVGTPPGGRDAPVPTIQDALETAIAQIAQSDVSVVAAGRTDAGVHATGQVIHADIPTSRPMTAWTRGVNAHLPPDISVRHAQEMPPAFHARFSATGRRYVYVIQNRPQRPGLLNGRVGWYHRPLDTDKMTAAAACLLGTHDFSSFRAAECQAKSPVKTLTTLNLTRRKDLVIIEVAANAFLHHMVRNIVGALIWVGNGKMPVAWMGDILQARDRTCAAPTFSPEGLYLSAVDYDAKWCFGVPESAREREIGVLHFFA
jgi:tRNA pseudouridine38-40 synthase